MWFLFLAAGAWCLVTQCITTKMGELHYGNTHNVEIFDLGHRILPWFYVPGLENLPVWMILGMLVLVNQGLEHFLHRATILCVLRGLTCICTILPVCFRQPPLRKTKWLIVNAVFFSRHDKIFSGHAALCWLASRHLSILPSPIFMLLNLSQVLLLLMARLHYTVDVVLGIILAELIFRAF